MSQFDFSIRREVEERDPRVLFSCWRDDTNQGCQKHIFDMTRKIQNKLGS